MSLQFERFSLVFLWIMITGVIYFFRQLDLEKAAYWPGFTTSIHSCIYVEKMRCLSRFYYFSYVHSNCAHDDGAG